MIKNIHEHAHNHAYNHAHARTHTRTHTHANMCPLAVHSLPSSLISYTVPVLNLTISVCTEGTDLGEVATGSDLYLQ